MDGIEVEKEAPFPVDLSMLVEDWAPAPARAPAAAEPEPDAFVSHVGPPITRGERQAQRGSSWGSRRRRTSSR